MRRAWIGCVVVALTCGCLPSTKIYKNPGDDDHGLRFYRPKPYLLVKPLTKSNGEPVAGYVSIETVMLPDFGEEYSIHIRSGLGINETRVTLADGWRLEALNVDLDSQADEGMEAMAEAMKLVPTLTSKPAGDDRFSVRATNVPLGYYEAVISKGPDCKKRLYGFRYVGFLPYSACPVESCGLERHACYDADLYALLFEDGAMVFRPLASAPGTAQQTAQQEHIGGFLTTEGARQ